MENRQKIWQRRGFLPVVIVIALVALAPKLFSQQLDAAIDAAVGGQNTDWYQLVGVIVGSLRPGAIRILKAFYINTFSVYIF